MSNSKQLKFVQGYEVQGVSPLAHYFEEIYGHTKGISNIGPRGDNHYFWYSKGGLGKAFYEVNEMELSAQSTYNFLNNPENLNRYFDGISKTVKEISDWIKFVENINTADLEDEEVFKYFTKSFQLDAKFFSYYLISQPYRLKQFEDQVREELKKRVAGIRIDSYLAKLTASEKLTSTSQEELDTARLFLNFKSRLIEDIDSVTFKNNHPPESEQLDELYEKYKVHTLGDGNWVLDKDKFLMNLAKEYKKPLHEFKKRIEKLENMPYEILKTRNKLIEELYIDKSTQKIISFLAEMSHVRFAMRVDGFIPLIYSTIKLSSELAKRLNLNDKEELYLTHIELEKLKAGSSIDRQELKDRMGKDEEYIIVLNEDKIIYKYGKEAGSLYRKLVPQVDHSKTTEVSGVIAEQGLVEGSATVYQWGDDMDVAMKHIKKHPILIAGQTRPSMMPIIREAKGIVTDEGGVTSHAAIVARELGLPTIINTHNATKVFKTGDRVTLDATKGIVTKVTS